MTKETPDPALDYFVDQFLPPGELGDIVVLGCGRGRHALRLANMSATVTAVDWLDEALEAMMISSRSSRWDCGDRLRPLYGDILQGVPGMYQGVVITEVLQQYSSYEATEILMRARDATLPGGHHLMTVCIEEAKHPYGGVFYRHDPDELVKLYSELLGMDVVHYEIRMPEAMCIVIAQK
jgi:hypothetical protein